MLIRKYKHEHHGFRFETTETLQVVTKVRVNEVNCSELLRSPQPADILAAIEADEGLRKAVVEKYGGASENADHASDLVSLAEVGADATMHTNNGRNVRHRLRTALATAADLRERAEKAERERDEAVAKAQEMAGDLADAEARADAEAQGHSEALATIERMWPVVEAAETLLDNLDSSELSDLPRPVVMVWGAASTYRAAAPSQTVTAGSVSDEDFADVKPCPEPDCMLRLDHKGKHQYGKDDPLVKKMGEIVARAGSTASTVTGPDKAISVGLSDADREELEAWRWLQQWASTGARSLRVGSLRGTGDLYAFDDIRKVAEAADPIDLARKLGRQG